MGRKRKLTEEELSKDNNAEGDNQPGEEEKTRISYTIDDADKDYLTDWARAEYRSVSRLVESLIDKAIDEREKEREEQKQNDSHDKTREKRVSRAVGKRRL